MLVNLPEGNRRGDFSRIISNTLLANLTNIGVKSTSNKVVGYFFLLHQKQPTSWLGVFFFCFFKSMGGFLYHPSRCIQKNNNKLACTWCFFCYIKKKSQQVGFLKDKKFPNLGGKITLNYLLQIVSSFVLLFFI